MISKAGSNAFSSSYSQLIGNLRQLVSSGSRVHQTRGIEYTAIRE